jgi:Tol biopolymer transport system component
LQGILWSPGGDEIWFTASASGSASNPRGVTISGKMRTITNIPGGAWLADIQNGTTLLVTHQQRIGIRGMAPGAKEERDLGWFGWSILSDVSRDGKKILFDEEGDGGGPNYTVFLRDTDGSPPLRIGEGNGMAISPDGKWVITKPGKGGQLSLVPTGAGEARQLTHDAISYGAVRFLLDGKHLLAVGIEAGHGARDYLIDLSTGQPKPITPEGISGSRLSPDGSRTVVIGPDNNWGVWQLDGSAMQPIPGLDSSYYINGWSPDGKFIYAASNKGNQRAAKVFQVDPTTGKLQPWKTFGGDAPGVTSVGAPHFSADGSGYAYVYVRILSQAYVVTGLK